MVTTLALAAAISIAAAARSTTWTDLPPAVQTRLEQSGLTASTFDGRIAALARDARTRVRQGDLEHLIHYLLQSAHFTRLPPIEPALSAREVFGGGRSGQPPVVIPPAVDARIGAFLKAIGSSDRDPRLGYFRALLADTVSGGDLRSALTAEYLRVMKFVYDKEFFSRGSPAMTAELYHSRGLSTDTAVEAGYSVQVGLGVLKALEPSRRIRRVLIVGPGIDLAPRTGLLEVGAPESYQPWAVIDALVSLGLSSLDDLEVVGADINPVSSIMRGARQTPRCGLVSGSRELVCCLLAGLPRVLSAWAVGRDDPSGWQGSCRASRQDRQRQHEGRRAAPCRAAEHRHRAPGRRTIRSRHRHQHPSLLRAD